jgi:hypothetical protein
MRCFFAKCALSALVFFLVLFGVLSPTAWGQPKTFKAPKTKFAPVAIQKNSTHCKQAYRIQVHTLSVVEASASLKPLLEAQLQSWLRWALEAETSTSNAPSVWVQEELARHETQDCEADKSEAQTPWERTLRVRHFFEDERYLSLSFEFFTFEGGAHENRQKQFVTWDKETKTPLSLTALSPEAEPLLELAEAEFRKAQKLKPEDAFEANGYWFDKGQFRLSEQFAFTECGLLLYYNPYEVAAYAVGPIEIFIPFAKLKALSKIPLPSKAFVKAFELCPNALPGAPPPPKPAPKQRPPAKAYMPGLNTLKLAEYHG